MIFSDIKTDEFQFGFQGLVKIGELGVAVSGHWGWGLGAAEVLQGLFLTLGRMTYSHLPNRFFI